jgi:hypothetical protein
MVPPCPDLSIVEAIIDKSGGLEMAIFFGLTALPVAGAKS